MPTAAAVAACAFCLAACGGGDGDSTSPSGAGASQSAPETVSPRSASFQKYSGRGAAKLHLAEFGTEGSDGDRTEVEAVIDSYLKATGAGEWKLACGFLSGEVMAQFREIAEQAKGLRKASCEEIIERLFESSQDLSDRSRLRASGGIASLRIKEGPGGGFALFHGSDGRDYWLAVKRVGDDWKVLSLGPQSFG